MSDINDAILQQLINRQKKDNFWRNIRFFVGLIVIVIFCLTLFGAIGQLFSPSKEPMQPYVSLVRMDGMVAANKPFSAQRLVPALQKAFKDPESRGVIIDINSGGGSPVQASIIYDNILALRKQYPKKHVVVVGEDMMASAAYLVAMAAPKIYVNPNTITGSIGVLTEGFGFVGAMKKFGITRRVITAGTNKVRLDPFEPLTKKDENKMKTVLNNVHAYFINVVKTSRGNRLKGDPKELFSGDFWTGMTAKKLGIVDNFGDIQRVMQTVFHVKKYRNYSPQPPLLQSLVGSFSSHLNINLGTLFHKNNML